MKSISALDKLFPAPKDGNPGSDAVMYRIVCSNATPNVTDNAAVITLTAMKITGSKRETATLSASLHFIDERSSYVKNPLTVTIAKGVTTSQNPMISLPSRRLSMDRMEQACWHNTVRVRRQVFFSEQAKLPMSQTFTTVMFQAMSGCARSRVLMPVTEAGSV